MSSKFNIFYGGITKILPDGEINIEEVVKILKSDELKSSVERIRQIEDSDPKILKKRRNDIKKHMIYVTPAGIFSQRKKNCLLKQSGLAPIDIDNIPIETITELKERLKSDEYAHLIFISPSGEGLKLFIKVPIDEKSYSAYVQGFYEYLNQKYDISIDSLDSSTKDISRACYLSYDPNVYYNSNSVEFKLLSERQFKKVVDDSRSGIEYRAIIRMLYMGLEKEQIFKEMETYSKWRESPESYKEHTYKNAKKYVDTTPLDKETKTNLINDMTRYILENYIVKTLLLKEQELRAEIYIYNDGIYTANGIAIIDMIINTQVGKYYNKALSTQVIDKIIPETRIDVDEFFEEPDAKYICVQNGILNLETNELQSFTPQMRFFSKLPIMYNPNAKCPNTIKHFQTILYEQDISLMQEIYGYFLYRKYPFHKAFMFSGDGGNGKGITINQIKAFLGNHNTTSLSLENIENDRFMIADLHKRLANLCGDIGFKPVQDARLFKHISGDDPITADRKFLSPLHFHNYAKFVFAANKIPQFYDDSDGLWRRWIFIRFDVSFVSQTKYDKLQAQNKLGHYHRKANDHIKEQITTPEELSGVLNWAIEGLQRLLEQNDFSYSLTPEETRKIMRKYSSTVLMFTDDCITQVPHHEQYEDVSELYSKYIEYCMSRKKRLKPISELQFKKDIETELPIQKKRTHNGYETRAYFSKFMGIPEDR